MATRPAREQEPESGSAESEVEETSENESIEEPVDSTDGGEDTDVESQESKKKDPSTEFSKAAGIAEGFLLILSVVFMGLVSLSTPIIKSLYLLSLDAGVNAGIDKVGEKAEFGIWGYCSTGVTNEVGVGALKHSFHTGGGCSKPKLGWTLSGVPGFSDEEKAASIHLTEALIVHVIVLAFILPALVISIFALVKPDLLVKKALEKKPKYKSGDEDGDDEDSDEDEDEDEDDADAADDPPEEAVVNGRRTLKSRVALAIFVALVLILVVLLIDLGAIVAINHKVHKLSHGIATVSYGPAFWLVCAAALCILLAFAASFIELTIFVGKFPRKKEPAEENEDGNDADDEGDGDDASNAPPETGASSDSKYSNTMVNVDLSEPGDRVRKSAKEN